MSAEEKGQVIPMQSIEPSDKAKIAGYQQLAITYEKYIQILGLEVNELSSISSIRGWTSQRVEIGQQLREIIQSLKKEVGFDDSFLHPKHS
jgi:hypothetical protein